MPVGRRKLESPPVSRLSRPDARTRPDLGPLGLLALLLLLAPGGWTRAVPVEDTAAAAPADGSNLVAGTVVGGLLDPLRFPLPERLKPNVRFWKEIFTRYTSNHVVVHDENDLSVIYEVLDLSPLDEETSLVARERLRRNAVRREQQRIEEGLRLLGAGKEPASVELAERLRKAWPARDDERRQFASAAASVRTQTGLKDVFAEAIARSGRYLPGIEVRFEKLGLPKALTRMPFVESMFQEGARSKVGAGGIWQIIPSTGRRFLSIGLEVDERYDPLLASEAAGKLLLENYQALGSWPLAITAYNYGRNGLRRAVSRLGTQDLGVIVDDHRSRSFGFASKNFYSEFIAAVETYENRALHFPEATPEEALRFDELTAPTYVPVKHLAARLELPVKVLQELNPAVSEEVWQGNLLLPGSYRLRLPAGTGGAFLAAYRELPDEHKPKHQIGLSYQVRPGDTVGAIARRYGTTVRAIQQANQLRRTNLIRVGQVLRIPPRPGSLGADTLVASASGVHVVRPSETLYSIARRYGTCVTAIVRANSLSRPDRIYVGQRLSIPDASSC